jgi:hypothetical protein
MFNLLAAVIVTANLTGAPSSNMGATFTAPKAIAQPSAPTLNKRDRAIATKLTAYILKKQKRAKPYAHRLAERIVIEARRNRIPVAVFVSIAQTESWFWWKVRGTSHEFGVWQIWPYSKAVAQEWAKLRKAGRIGTLPDKPWRKLGYKDRQRVLQDIDAGTALAAQILRRLVRWCTARHKIHRERLLGSRRHRTWTDRYAHYNSGYKWPKPGYYYQLRRYNATIQAYLSAP